jgi:hypothetical protein
MPHSCRFPLPSAAGASGESMQIHSHSVRLELCAMKHDPSYDSSPPKATWMAYVYGLVAIMFAVASCALFYIWSTHWDAILNYFAPRAHAAWFVGGFFLGFLVLPAVSIICGILGIRRARRDNRLFASFLNQFAVGLSVLFLLFIAFIYCLLSNFPVQT